MQVARWGDGLAVHVPSSVAEELGLKEGDDVRIRIAGPGTLELRLMPAAIGGEAIANLRKYRGRLRRTSTSIVRKRMDDVEPFLDTNVLLYLLSADAAKADRAEALLAAGGVISVQVLNEFANVASRKLAMTWPEIREILAAVRTTCSRAHEVAGTPKAGAATEQADGSACSGRGASFVSPSRTPAGPD